MSVRSYPISVKTAEPIGLTFVVGPRVTPFSIFKDFENPRIFFLNPRNFLFVFVLQCTQREHVHNGSGRWAISALILSVIIF